MPVLASHRPSPGACSQARDRSAPLLGPVPPRSLRPGEGVTSTSGMQSTRTERRNETQLRGTRCAIARAGAQRLVNASGNHPQRRCQICRPRSPATRSAHVLGALFTTPQPRVARISRIAGVLRHAASVPRTPGGGAGYGRAATSPAITSPISCDLTSALWRWRPCIPHALNYAYIACILRWFS